MVPDVQSHFATARPAIRKTTGFAALLFFLVLSPFCESEKPFWLANFWIESRRAREGNVHTKLRAAMVFSNDLRPPLISYQHFNGGGNWLSNWKESCRATLERRQCLEDRCLLLPKDSQTGNIFFKCSTGCFEEHKKTVSPCGIQGLG